ncbi:protein HGV2 [Caerostris darwini]|uniref:Protein HGV2 n=1 Tax=Caerostris darwini TaxID=1538125 RepID=A0AAV4UJ68_9ARAC|nr:protein HGV2 [Caerostris darwini]
MENTEKVITSVDESPSRSKDLSKTLPEEAFNNFVQGKRHMLVQDYKFAVQSLATACELYTEHFGELAAECAEVHFYYGKALFRLSQQQAGVLGGALNEDANDDDDDDEDEEEPEKSSEEESKENDESEKNESDAENGEGNQEETDEIAEEEKELSESTDSPQQVVEDSSKEPVGKEGDQSLSAEKETPNEAEQEPEEDDLELAWNSLETAKSIYQRQGENNTEAQLKIADIYQLLAEISMESDNNIAAISDLKTSLEIKNRLLEPDDRLLAETYYQMGLAQMLEKMYSEALDNFRITVKILELKKENLKSTPVDETPGSFARADIEKEIEDLDSVLADIREKIEDTTELNDESQKLKADVSGEDTFHEPEKQIINTNKPVSNITHLLKRKKPDQDEAEREAKRVKLSTTVQNGDATVTE